MTTALSPSQRASTFGQAATFRNLAPGGFSLQKRIAVIGQAATSVVGALDFTKKQIFSSQEAGATYGFGSPIHEVALRLLPPTGDGVGNIPVTVYPLADGTTASLGDITPTGTTTASGTYTVWMNNIQGGSFQLASGANVAAATLAITGAVNSTLRFPMTAVDGATVVDLTAKWKGLTGDDINVKIVGPSVGMTFGFTQPTGGAVDPVIDAAVTDQFGDVWETFVVQTLGDTTAALDALAAFNEGRWAPTVAKFFVAFYGTTEADLATAITVPDSRGTDRTNSQIPSPGSDDLPWAVAARAVAQIALQANSASPATDYVGAQATGLVPGVPADQWNESQRQTAVTSGASTVEIIDGNVTLGDTLTFHHPTGDPTPAYQYVVDVVKLMELMNDLRLVFKSPRWIGKPLIPNSQASKNKDARRPRMAEAEMAKLADSWADEALISDPETAKKTIHSAINGSNPKRLDNEMTVQLSGNANVIDQDLFFGFFFGA